MKEVELVVIGGGAAGMAAAVSAYKNGVRDILILERNSALGDVLQQCIHNGFGLHRFKEDLTGVEFAARYADMVEELEIPYLLNTFVIELRPDRTITAVSPEEGLMEIQAKAIVLAMGCRERSRNALLIPGARGAGIMTAGTAQRYLNIDGYLPGRRIVIVGSGDIGLIMARQFVLEGCEVAAVVEIMPYSGGLPRNMKQCIEDFDIPVYYNSVISEVRGKERVSSVLVGKVDEDRRLIPGTEFEISCDTLLISAGLIPENELTESAGIAMSRATKGALVTEDLQTSIPGIFSCGNVLHVHDLVDFVSEEGEEAGRNAAAWLLAQKATAPKKAASEETASNETPLPETASKETAQIETASKETALKETAVSCIRVLSGDGVGGIVPQTVRRDTPLPEVHFMFRPRARYRDAVITARYSGTVNISGAGENSTTNAGGQAGQESMNTSGAGENSTANAVGQAGQDSRITSEAGKINAAARAGGQASQDSRILTQKRFLALTLGEMCKITIPAEKLKNVPEIVFDIEGTKV